MTLPRNYLAQEKVIGQLVGATGFEPAVDFDASADGYCDCEFCQEYRAANALHSGRSNCLDAASLDADLQRVIEAWNTFPETIRAAIIALSEMARTRLSTSVQQRRLAPPASSSSVQ